MSEVNIPLHSTDDIVEFLKGVSNDDTLWLVNIDRNQTLVDVPGCDTPRKASYVAHLDIKVAPASATRMSIVKDECSEDKLCDAQECFSSSAPEVIS